MVGVGAAVVLMADMVMVRVCGLVVLVARVIVR